MINTETRDDVTILTLAKGGANAIDSELLKALRAAFKEAVDAGKPIVLTDEGEKIFCAGLDLVSLAGADRVVVTTLVHELYFTLFELFNAPVPVVAALNGHAVAGGALVALTTDWRVMSAGKGRIGMSEAQIGVSIPASALELMRYRLRPPHLDRIAYAGELHPVDDALRMGLIDETVEASALLETAVARARSFAPSLPAFTEMKTNLRRDVKAAMEAARERDEAFLDKWFSDEGQARIKATVAKLTGKG